jgi:hypothetical protein
MAYLTRSFPVVASDVHDLVRRTHIPVTGAATLEVWVDTTDPDDTNPGVQLELNTSAGHFLFVARGTVAATLPDLLDERVDFDKFGTDEDGEDARLKCSWDPTGADLKMTFKDLKVAMSISDLDVMAQIADAIRDCVAILDAES